MEPLDYIYIVIAVWNRSTSFIRKILLVQGWLATIFGYKDFGCLSAISGRFNLFKYKLYCVIIRRHFEHILLLLA